MLLPWSGLTPGQKLTGAQALLRIIGSIAFSAAPRSIYLIVRDEEDEDKRLFLPAKNNIAKIRTGLAFRVIEKFAPPLNDGYPAIKSKVDSHYDRRRGAGAEA